MTSQDVTEWFEAANDHSIWQINTVSIGTNWLIASVKHQNFVVMYSIFVATKMFYCTHTWTTKRSTDRQTLQVKSEGGPDIQSWQNWKMIIYKIRGMKKNFRQWKISDLFLLFRQLWTLLKTYQGFEPIFSTILRCLLSITFGFSTNWNVIYWIIKKESLLGLNLVLSVCTGKITLKYR